MNKISISITIAIVFTLLTAALIYLEIPAFLFQTFEPNETNIVEVSEVENSEYNVALVNRSAYRIEGLLEHFRLGRVLNTKKYFCFLSKANSSDYYYLDGFSEAGRDCRRIIGIGDYILFQNYRLSDTGFGYEPNNKISLFSIESNKIGNECSFGSEDIMYVFVDNVSQKVAVVTDAATLHVYDLRDSSVSEEVYQLEYDIDWTKAKEVVGDDKYFLPTEYFGKAESLVSKDEMSFSITDKAYWSDSQKVVFVFHFNFLEGTMQLDTRVISI